MHVLFLTTVDSSFSVLFSTWLTLLLYSLSSSIVEDAGTSVQYSLAVGCMPSAHRINDGRPADNRVSWLPAGLNCTHIKDIPGFDTEGKTHLKKYFVSYPDVRRMMMVNAFASTGQYDMIVYSDLDSFIVRNPVSDLMKYRPQNYSAVFSRSNYNISVVCNGFYALNDMSLPKYWIAHGVYSQNEINNWIDAGKKEVKDFYFTYNVRRSTAGVDFKLGLLPEPDYFRGGCGTLMVPTRKVEHCHANFFNGKKKIETFITLNRLIAVDDRQEQLNVSKVLSSAVHPSGKGVSVSDFLYKKRDSKMSIPNEYDMTLHSHRLTPSVALQSAITELPRWVGLKTAYEL